MISGLLWKLGVGGTIATVVAVFKLDPDIAQQIGIASSGVLFAALLSTVFE